MKRYKTDSDPEVREVELSFAKKGIVAMYGGRKGNGFWLHRVTVDLAMLAYNDFFAYLRQAIDQNVQEETLTNDGKKSGNPYFFMWDDAVKLLAEGL